MFTTISTFLATWTMESANTIKVLEALTDASLAQAVVPGGRTLGRLAWHLPITHAEMFQLAGVTEVKGPAEDAPVPTTAAAILAAYRESAASLVERIPACWTDADLPVEIPMYMGENWPRAMVLGAVVAHEIHHRGQMTVLMRQAGLAVPGVYGPSGSELAAMGASVPE